MSAVELSIGQCATLACMLEATAPKPGNVHRGADFEDLTFTDMAVSAVVIGPVFERARQQRLGATVLQAAQATAQCVRTNPNLGIILLFAPLASVSADRQLRPGTQEILSRLNSEDAAQVYEAIRMARAGGLGTVEKMDIAGPSPPSLMEAMTFAQSRDFIARQYVNGFAEVFDCVVPWLVQGQQAGWTLTQTIIRVHLQVMAAFPDSLIARKCGSPIANQSQIYAQRTLEAGLPYDENYEGAIADFDFWLRSDGHRRNPGTTADLVAAGLFVALRDRLIHPPWN